MEQVTKLTPLTPRQAGVPLPPKPHETQGESEHPSYCWIKLRWKAVFTTVGLDHAYAEVLVLNKRNGHTIDSVQAHASNDRKWTFGASSRHFDPHQWGRRILAMETLRTLTKELDEAGWKA